MAEDGIFIDEPTVTRSVVEQKSRYQDYKPELQYDFIYSCAYCTITDAEATTIRMTIDHYLPQEKVPELKNDYNNLYYCCDDCNQYKGDRIITDQQRADGKWIFKADHDVWSEHFRINGRQLQTLTNCGECTADAVDLHRPELAQLRDLRQRAADCNQYISQGARGLRRFPIDQLPPHLKGEVRRAIDQGLGLAKRYEALLDDVLRARARSPLDVEDPDHKKRRAEANKRLRSPAPLYPTKPTT